jgi:AcrR family transcriptional regulator
MSQKRTSKLGADPYRRRRGRPPYDSARTREALMDAAEELFSTFGFEGASVRSIEAAAGVTPAVVHYHYASKHRLLEAVLHRRGDEIARRTNELLDALAEGTRRPTTRDVVAALARPWVEMLQRDPDRGLCWARLIARLHLSQNPLMARLDTGPDGSEEHFWRLVRQVSPGVAESQMERAWRISFGILMLMLGNSDSRIAHGAGTGSTHISQTYVDTLVDFVAAGCDQVMVGRDARPARQRRKRS